MSRPTAIVPLVRTNETNNNNNHHNRNAENQQQCRQNLSLCYYRYLWRREGRGRACRIRNLTHSHLHSTLRIRRRHLMFLRLSHQPSRRGVTFDIQVPALQLTLPATLQPPTARHHQASLRNPGSDRFLMSKRNHMRGRKNSIF